MKHTTTMQEGRDPLLTLCRLRAKYGGNIQGVSEEEHEKKRKKNIAM